MYILIILFVTSVNCGQFEDVEEYVYDYEEHLEAQDYDDNFRQPPSFCFPVLVEIECNGGPVVEERPVLCSDGKFFPKMEIDFKFDALQNNITECQYRYDGIKEYKFLTMTFESLKVKDSKGCSEDYIEIHNGNSTADPILGRFCGSEVPKHAVTTSIGSGTIFIKINNSGLQEFSFMATLDLGFCADSKYGDRFCDSENDFENCNNFDGGDCRGLKMSPSWPNCRHNPDFIGDGICDYRFATDESCNGDSGDCYLNPKLESPEHCPQKNASSIGDGTCQKGNVDKLCDYDGGDCCTESLIGDGVCNFVNNFETCSGYDGGDCSQDFPYCRLPFTINDGKCDQVNRNSECNFDGGDCDGVAYDEEEDEESEDYYRPVFG